MAVLCKIEYCDRPSRARGLCRPHYRALMVHGDPEQPDKRERLAGLCNRPNCRRNAESRGLCDTHYQRVRRGAEPPELGLQDVGPYYGRERRLAVAWSKPRAAGSAGNIEAVMPGMPVHEIAAELGVTERTVWRWLAAERSRPAG